MKVRLPELPADPGDACASASERLARLVSAASGVPVAPADRDEDFDGHVELTCWIRRDDWEAGVSLIGLWEDDRAPESWELKAFVRDAPIVSPRRRWFAAHGFNAFVVLYTALALVLLGPGLMDRELGVGTVLGAIAGVSVLGLVSTVLVETFVFPARATRIPPPATVSAWRAELVAHLGGGAGIERVHARP